MVTLEIDNITVDEYLSIRSKVGWRELSVEQAKKAIDNSLIIVKAVDDEGTVIGMGRIVGDGAVICYIQDLIVVPEAQGKGVGSMIVDRLTKFADDLRLDGTLMMFCLMCAKGREPFYQKHGFITRPNEQLGPGMIQYLKDK